MVGRDLVRLLQNVARIPEFEQLWKDIIHNPQVLSAQFTGRQGQRGGQIRPALPTGREQPPPCPQWPRATPCAFGRLLTPLSVRHKAKHAGRGGSSQMLS